MASAFGGKMAGVHRSPSMRRSAACDGPTRRPRWVATRTIYEDDDFSLCKEKIARPKYVRVYFVHSQYSVRTRVFRTTFVMARRVMAPRDGPPRDGPPRDGPPRDGPRDGPPRDGKKKKKQKKKVPISSS